ncbi:hypothetical protein WJX84_007119 [Apatococcus fuscideae]|uniref:Prefoldin subunit 4 n=1 Tax=Apatococcus fuscideae TaxID=2026836 RepID=A0AAW1T336_9CHLO
MASQPKSNAEVTYEDQQHINKFSKMHLRSKDILAEIKVKKSEVEELEDAGNELILADEEEVRYHVGECFHHVSVPDAEDLLQTARDAAEEELAKSQTELEELEASMKELKKVLYGKFGNSINLEE